MQCRRRSRRADRLLFGWLLSLLLATMASAQDGGRAPETERLVLSVALNGAPAGGDPLLVERRGTVLTMRTADLRALGIAVKSDAAEVALATVPGLVATVDDGAQVIVLGWRPRPAAAGLDTPVEPVTPGGWGAAINYDLAATRAGGRTTLGALVDGVIHGPRGYAYGGVAMTGRRAALLDVGYTTADPTSARRFTVGHTITGATERSRPVRLLGVQLATDFALRPDLITTPLPDLGTGAAVPTATDVIVDGRPARGAFATTDLPIQTGVNTVTTTVRDALGRETRQTLSTYVSPVLLRRGLTAVSAEAGLVRRGYGNVDRYGPPAASVTWRAGLDDRLTIETHAELSGRVGVGGAGAALGLGAVGLVSGSVAASAAGADNPRGGLQWGVGYERVARPVSIAARYTGSSAGWRDLAGDGGAPTRSHVAILTLGFDLARLGTIGVTAIDQGRGRPGRADPRFVTPRYTLPPSRFVTASWSTRVAARLSLVANGGIDTRRRGSGYLSIGALLIAGPRQHGYAGAIARDGGTSTDARWRRTAISPGDWGYGVAVAAGGGLDRQAGELAWQGPRGRYLGELERVNGTVAARVSARGAVAIGGDGVMLADRLTDSYAVVDAGLPGITVYRDNRPAGVTDRHGRLIVADLPARVETRFALDPLQLADDITVGAVEHRVRPAERAGVPVRFDLHPSRAATVRLLLPDGTPVPAGARATLNGGASLPVGLDGETWLPVLERHNLLRIDQAGRALCTIAFPAPATPHPGGNIGALTCAPPTTLSLSMPSAARPPPH